MIAERPVTDPCESPTPPAWAIEQARAALKSGMNPGEIERRLVNVGLSAAAAKAAVQCVSEQRIVKPDESQQAVVQGRATDSFSIAPLNVDVTKPIDAPPTSDWPLERARTFLKMGLSVPETERRLMDLGLSQMAAEGVTNQVLEEKVGTQTQTSEPPSKWLFWHRLLSSVLGAGCILMGYAAGGPMRLVEVFLWIGIPIVGIWCADQQWYRWSRLRGSKSPPWVIRLVGWFILILYALFRVEVFVLQLTR
jgi:hypothetical protein